METQEFDNLKDLKERMEYMVTEDGYYIGKLVNAEGCVTQAKSLDELKKRMKFAFLTWNEVMVATSKNDFELKEVSREEFMSSIDEVLTLRELAEAKKLLTETLDISRAYTWTDKVREFLKK